MSRLPAELKDAAEHVLSHAHGMRAVLVLAEHVKDIELIEQGAAEAENRRDAARTEAEKIDARIAAATSKEGDIAKDKAEAKEAVTAAKRDAAKIDEEARISAGKIVMQAEAEAGKIKAEAASIKAEALKGADAELEAKRAEVIEAGRRLSDLLAETAEVQRKADDARAYLSSLKV